TLDHPHSQLIALPIVPSLVREEVEGSKAYFGNRERCIYCDIIRQETGSGVRVIANSRDFVTLAPYAPRFPFETWILPTQHESAFENSPSGLYEGLARALKEILQRMDQVLENPAYNLVIHTSPLMEANNDFYHCH